jgi:hypothetical protein
VKGRIGPSGIALAADLAVGQRRRGEIENL